MVTVVFVQAIVASPQLQEDLIELGNVILIYTATVNEYKRIFAIPSRLSFYIELIFDTLDNK